MTIAEERASEGSDEVNSRTEGAPEATTRSSPESQKERRQAFKEVQRVACGETSGGTQVAVDPKHRADQER